jgi:hypothetical protein
MIIDDDLDYTPYGTQGPHLAALINRCATLTPQEAELLACIWDPVLRDADDDCDHPAKATRKQSKHLTRARAVARAAAWRASGLANRDTSDASPLIMRASDLARHATRHSGRRTAAAATHAVKDVIIAVAIRDLINAHEQHNPGQWAAYDLLTWSWRSVIGPVHPRDVER